MRCRPGAFVTVTLVFYCYSEAKEFTYQGGKENNLTWAKTLYVNTIKVISGVKLEKSACTGLLCMSAATRATVLLPGKGSGETSDRLEQS